MEGSTIIQKIYKSDPRPLKNIKFKKIEELSI